MSIKPCDQDVFDNGQSVCLVDIPKEAAENICRSLSAAIGYKIDWHYIGGRVHIKALAATVVERQPEPVAWALLNGNGQIRDLTDSWGVAKHWDGTVQSLYDSPPAPVAVALDPCEWSDGQILDFLGVALRNVDLSGEVKLSEIRQGFEYVRQNSCLDKVKELNQ